MTFVSDDYLSDLGSFGVDPGDHFKIEAGAFLKARAELPVMENVNLITTADFFTPSSLKVFTSLSYFSVIFRVADSTLLIFILMSTSQLTSTLPKSLL